MLKRVFAVRPQPAFTSFALLLLRVAAGVAFAIHGSSKIANPFGWMGDGAFAPPWLQALAALSEFGGGIAWALGLVTPLACFGIACTMAVATWSVAVTKGEPFVAKPGGASWELPTVYFCVAMVLMGTGPGAFSLDRRFFGVRGQPVSPA